MARNTLDALALENPATGGHLADDLAMAVEPAPASTQASSSTSAFELAMLSDVGTTRSGNEDCCGHLVENPDTALIVVADGIGGYEGGEIASSMAVELTIQSYRESPPAWGAAKRLGRAVQFANIEIYNKALTVPELRRMGTTLTAMVIEKGMLSAAHVGDCRIYHLRHGKITQLSKDHTVVGERVRMGLLSEAEARNHPERSHLLRSVGHELIVSVDHLRMPLIQDDHLVLCTDGLHQTLDAREIERVVHGLNPGEACRRLINTATQRGTLDNLTAAIFHVRGDTGLEPLPTGWRARLANQFRR